MLESVNFQKCEFQLFNHLLICSFIFSPYKHLFRLVSSCMIIRPQIQQERENFKKVPCCFKWLDNADPIIFSCSGDVEGSRLAFHSCRGKTICCKMWERELSHPAASGQAFQVFHCLGRDLKRLTH